MSIEFSGLQNCRGCAEWRLAESDGQVPVKRELVRHFPQPAILHNLRNARHELGAQVLPLSPLCELLHTVLLQFGDWTARCEPRLHTILYIYIVYSIVYILHYVLYILSLIFYNHVVYIVYCILYSVYCLLFFTYYILYNIHCTSYIIDCILFTCSALYTMHCMY